MPAAPMPEMALPRIKAIELGEAPQMAEPSSKRNTLENKTYRTGKNVKSFPKASCRAQQVKR